MVFQSSLLGIPQLSETPPVLSVICLHFAL